MDRAALALNPKYQALVAFAGNMQNVRVDHSHFNSAAITSSVLCGT